MFFTGAAPAVATQSENTITKTAVFRVFMELPPPRTMVWISQRECRPLLKTRSAAPSRSFRPRSRCSRFQVRHEGSIGCDRTEKALRPQGHTLWGALGIMLLHLPLPERA